MVYERLNGRRRMRSVRNDLIFFDSLFLFLFLFLLPFSREREDERPYGTRGGREREKSVVVHGMCRKRREAYLCVRIERATVERGY